MIDKELFIEVMEEAKKSDDYQNWLNQQLRKNGAGGYLFQPNCIDSVLKLLHFSFKESDVNDTIAYFCFELDYGRKWKPGMITEKDGTDIILSTSEDLYNYLVSQNH